jgi:hypothetical protein
VSCPSRLWYRNHPVFKPLPSSEPLSYKIGTRTRCLRPPVILYSIYGTRPDAPLEFLRRTIDFRSVNGERWWELPMNAMKRTSLEEVRERLREAEDLTWGPFTKLRDTVAAEESRIVRCSVAAAERLAKIVASRSTRLTGELANAGDANVRWDRIALALQQDYDELDALRDAARSRSRPPGR